MATEIQIRQVQPSPLPTPFKARVIRKWVMYKRRKWGSYLLIDKAGDTMHAMFRLVDEHVLDSKITLMNCYIFDDYVCQHAPTLLRVGNHTASIKIDHVATITAVDDDSDIPRRFYRFVPYKELHFRREKIDFLTDFIGRVESIEHIDTQSDNSLLRVTMQDVSGDSIVVALWKEIVALIDTVALAATNHTVIAAIASVKVVDFHGDMQLESTAATRVEINPDIQIANEMINSFQPPEPTDVPRITFTPKIADRERVTLASLYQEDMKKFYDAKHTCEATITEITRGRSWFFVRCVPCKRTILASADGYKCPRHGAMSLRYRYSVNCTIEDTTGKAYVTIFDEAMNTLLGTRCYDMITMQGYSDSDKTPEPLYAIRGMKMIFRLQRGEMAHDDILSFVVNKVFHPDNDIGASSAGTTSPPLALAELPDPEKQLQAVLPQPQAPAATATDTNVRQQQQSSLAPTTPAKQAPTITTQASPEQSSGAADPASASTGKSVQSCPKKMHLPEKGLPTANKKLRMQTPE